MSVCRAYSVFSNPTSLLVWDYKKTEQQSITLPLNIKQTGESAGVRTRDPNIKSVVLYLLSYGFSDVPMLSRLVVQR